MEQVYEAADTLEVSVNTLFQRAFRWYFSADGTHTSQSDFEAWQKNKENVPTYVEAFTAEVLRQGRRAHLTL